MNFEALKLTYISCADKPVRWPTLVGSHEKSKKIPQNLRNCYVHIFSVGRQNVISYENDIENGFPYFWNFLQARMLYDK